MLTLKNIAINSIISNRKLRKELFEGDYPQELKEKVAARYIEEWIISDALNRKSLYDKRRESRLSRISRHGFYFFQNGHDPFCQFYWFGKKHGHSRLNMECYPDSFAWYNIDKLHGPYLGTGKYDEFGYVFEEFKNGNVIHEETDIVDRDRYVNEKIRTYESHSWLIRETSKFILILSYLGDDYINMVIHADGDSNNNVRVEIEKMHNNASPDNLKYCIENIKNHDDFVDALFYHPRQNIDNN